MVEVNVFDGYITRSDLAAQLNKSERTLERWGILQIGPPITWLGRQPVYKVDSVREWLKSCEQNLPRKSRERAGAAA
jgi:hypothetical protein